MTRILLVEDEADIAEALIDNLEAEGFAVQHCATGPNAVECFASELIDFVVLDVMLPGFDGFEVCRRIRSAGSRVPILFLSAKSAGEDRISGLEAGGDDYIAKPFVFEELLLRIRAILRREAWYEETKKASDTASIGPHVIDFERYVAQVAGRSIELSPKEAMILRMLMDNRGKPVSRDEILDRVWGMNAYPSSRTVDNFIVKLRRIFESDPANPRYIHTLRGVGYKLNED